MVQFTAETEMETTPLKGFRLKLTGKRRKKRLSNRGPQLPEEKRGLTALHIQIKGKKKGHESCTNQRNLPGEGDSSRTA